MFTANHSAGITRGATSLATALLGALAVLLLATAPSPVATQVREFEVSVTEVWTTGEDISAFSFPEGMAQWPDGSVWAGDSRLSEVYEISSDGTRIQVALREGDGPREVGRVDWIVASPAGGMVIWDNRRVGFFDADKRPRRRVPIPAGIWSWGFAAAPDGGFLISGGFGYEKDHELTRFAVHRYDRRARHVKSWHPTADHDDWEVVRSTSGGPVALTRSGGVLVSDAAPFRITRYSDLDGGGGQLVVEDESIVASSELDRAVVRGPRQSITYTSRWSRSAFVHEMEDGRILNVVSVFPENDDTPGTSLWVVVSPNGRVLARTQVAEHYQVWSATPDGHFLATYWDDEKLQFFATKLAVRF